MRKLIGSCCLLLLASCGSDDDKNDNPSAAHAVEVCIVFAPGELGDQGYADRVLTGLYQFGQQLSEADRDRVLTHYINAADSMLLAQRLHQWQEQGANPYTGQSYERRLLVLTAADQLPMLADTPLSDTDEVLLLNVSNAVAAAAPKAAQLGSRLHTLSISAAEAGKKLCQRIDAAISQYDDIDERPAVVVFQDRHEAADRADSIATVMAAHFGQSLLTFPLPATEGNPVSFAFNLMKSFADNRVQAVCTWGAANAAIFTSCTLRDTGDSDYYFLDTEFTGLFTLPTIVRHYDRALSQWLVRWLQAAEQMPDREWHGAWDGYTTDNL